MPEKQSSSGARPFSNTAPPGPAFFYDRFRARPLSRTWLVSVSVIVIVIVIVITLLWLFFWRAPAGFPVGASIEVPKGAGLNGAAELLSERKVIRSPFWFKAASVLRNGERRVKAGVYSFSKPVSVFALAKELVRGNGKEALVRVTIPEGTNNRQMAKLFRAEFLRFDSEKFLSLAGREEGRLFPDTYLLPPDAREEEIIRVLKETFDSRVAALEHELRRLGRPLEEILLMASLVEEEARTEETRRKVAGILWKRLDAGLPLQVDAVFPYIFGALPFDLTDGDLLVDSPYNTYKYAGLPPTPITNPGLAAIQDTINPVETPFWYYLSDREGNMHYAVTHDEHLVNRAKYLGSENQ